MNEYPKISTLKTPEAFAAHLDSLGLPHWFEPEMKAGADSALARPVQLNGRSVGNRWAILPMEGWDCLPDGSPSELTERRWLRFGESGAKMIFGCEAAAVMLSGKSNTRQMMITTETAENLGKLRRKMVDRHAGKFGTADDLYVGLQLTHSGRYSHPDDDKILKSVTAYAHPLLDRKFGNSAANVVSDGELDEIVATFIAAARLARDAGFHFVDIKHAHGYLGHELLSAIERPGKYGGSFENRTRFFREITQGIRSEVPGIDISLRFSIFDMIPFEKGPDRAGRPMQWDGPYPYAFGGDGSGAGYDLTEPLEFLRLAHSLGVKFICATVGSPYYNPHIQRPAYYPVSDGYLPPEDPLTGAFRQIKVVAEMKKLIPEMNIIGSGYTCLQEWLPNVAEYVTGHGMADFVGIGRMVLSYPDICADQLQGRGLDKRKICRTFGDCTTAPRNGLVSGCYPLDHYYRELESAEKLKDLKKRLS
jgi:2,4-dienoyl-CoA reductase-like NADH-dependent reductase (Old Yellow Enzyme family)